jgi:hypothetical protein
VPLFRYSLVFLWAVPALLHTASAGHRPTRLLVGPLPNSATRKDIYPNR